jgi:hypothetical protein
LHLRQVVLAAATSLLKKAKSTLNQRVPCVKDRTFLPKVKPGKSLPPKVGLPARPTPYSFAMNYADRQREAAVRSAAAAENRLMRDACSSSSARRKFRARRAAESEPNEEQDMINKPVLASKHVDGMPMSAEFHRDTGRLRILDGGVVLAEWFPPHSWFAIASVAGYSTWGTRPSEQDLARLLDDFALHAGVRHGVDP